MNENRKPKRYDLEDRTLQFARDVRAFVRRIPKTPWNQDDLVQLINASGSVGANYIEANECLGKKDFRMRIKISKKESKESRFWLRVLDIDTDQQINQERLRLIQEATELMNILGAILQKTGP